MAQNGSVRTNSNVPNHSADESKKYDMDRIISCMPKVGYINSEGHTVLPRSEYCEEDDIYEE